MVDVQKLRLFTISDLRARLSAGIGVVDVKKLRLFTISEVRARDPLQGLAWSMCKNWGLFAISEARAQPSAGIALLLWPRTNSS